MHGYIKGIYPCRPNFTNGLNSSFRLVLGVPRKLVYNRAHVSTLVAVNQVGLNVRVLSGLGLVALLSLILGVLGLIIGCPT